MRLSHFTLAGLGAIFLDTPAQAATEKSLTMVAIFSNAAVPVKLIAIILLVGLVAAPGLALARRDTKWLQAIARSALPLGFAAAAYTLLACAVGVANLGVTPSLPILAPGLAEALMMAMLGLLTTGVARLSSELAERRNQAAGLA
jgi:hypothetical protein